MEADSNRPLFAPLKLGALELKHRIVLVGAPRGLGVTLAGEPDPSLSAYFATRATPGGLLICCVAPVPEPRSSGPRVPGIHSSAQVNGWRDLTAAIHARGGV